MPKYKNPRIQEELDQVDQEDQHEKVMKEVPKNDEDEGWKKRYGDLRRHQQEQEASLKQEVLNLKKQMEGIKTGSVRPPKSEAELKQWEEEYPDFSDILDARIRRSIREETQDLKIQSKEIKKREALADLKKEHPDCQEIFDDPAFHDWLKTKPIFQNAIYKSFSVSDAADVLSTWKLKSKKAKKTDDDDYNPRDAAKAVKTRSKNAFSEDSDNDYDFSESQIDRESNRNPRWWSQNEKKIDEARGKGRILYDLSGGAR